MKNIDQKVIQEKIFQDVNSLFNEQNETSYSRNVEHLKYKQYDTFTSSRLPFILTICVLAYFIIEFFH